MAWTTEGEDLTAKEWTAHIHLSEHGRDTSARAVLNTGDNVLEGKAEAHRSPVDPSVPEIGDELAAGRALQDLAQQLMGAAARDSRALDEEREMRGW
ncbi:DUF1876 domain-containing protein [Streptomyces sodiiphilus]|uniref:DUF1876 domain-containing protein n=1 Tax=Streptomyces sodiiphilus TaxID=226217 RepID=A0ABN2P5J1_9ACTN